MSGADRVRCSRELAAMRDLEDAHLSLLQAENKLAELGREASAGNIARVRQRLEREGSLVRGALGLDDQLRRVG